MIRTGNSGGRKKLLDIFKLGRCIIDEKNDVQVKCYGKVKYVSGWIDGRMERHMVGLMLVSKT